MYCIRLGLEDTQLDTTRMAAIAAANTRAGSNSTVDGLVDHRFPRVRDGPLETAADIQSWMLVTLAVLGPPRLPCMDTIPHRQIVL